MCGSGEVVEVLGVTAQGVFARQRLWLGCEVHVQDIVLLSPFEMLVLASSPAPASPCPRAGAGEAIVWECGNRFQSIGQRDDTVYAASTLQSKQQSLTDVQRCAAYTRGYIVECRAQGTWQVEGFLPCDLGPTARASALLTGTGCMYVCVCERVPSLRALVY